MDFNGNPLNNYVGGHSASAGYGYSTSTGQWYRNGFNLGSVTNPPAFPSSGIIGVAFDADNGKLYFHRNGTWINSADPVAGTNANFTASTIQSGYLPAISTYNNQGTWSANFGQFPFAYTPPTGYKKLNTYNLPDSTIKDGSQYMKAISYSGNGSSQNIITGFSPDLVWTKSRSTTDYHWINDSIRGISKYINSNTTDAESTFAGGVTALNSDGYTVEYSGSNAWNASGQTYVGWSWRGSDSSPVSNTDGTITSTVSANTDSGFSVVTWTGTSTNASTVGHGLSTAPKLIITKSRSNASSWIVGIGNISGFSVNDYLVLQSTGAKANSSTFYQAYGSDTFTVGVSASNEMNKTGNNYVSYCFSEVEGFSKIATYTGNGINGDGPFVYCGFRPAFILFKNTNTTQNWIIHDTARDSYNYARYWLFPNTSGAEYTDANIQVDLVSNGFKIRTSIGTELNGNGNTIVYMAFAENPFKHSLAR